MDRYLLDSNAASGLLRGNQPNLTRRSDALSPERQIVVRAELLFGWQSAPAYAPRIQELRTFLRSFPTLAFDDSVAEEYGKLRAHLRATGMTIGSNDLLIASIALAHDLILVTHNTGEFSRVPGLRLEDWQ